MDARLHVLGGSRSGQTIRVSRKLLIGRGADCDLRLTSEFVSSHHCVLLLDDKSLRIRDLGSKNGTFTSGRRIGTSVTVLSHDDTITVGDVQLLVDLRPLPPGAPPAEQPIGLPNPQVSVAESTGLLVCDSVDGTDPSLSPPRPADASQPAAPVQSHAPTSPSDQSGSQVGEEESHD